MVGHMHGVRVARGVYGGVFMERWKREEVR